MKLKLHSSFNQVTQEFMDAHQKINPSARAVDKVKGSREKKKQERDTKLATILDKEKKFQKSVKDGETFGNFSFESDKNSHVIDVDASNSPRNKKQQAIDNICTQKVKRAKKRAICMCCLHKPNSQLTEIEKMNKK